MISNINTFFLLNSLEYKQGYENGFNCARNIVIKEIEDVLKRLKKSEPFFEYTSTASTKY